MRSWNMEFGTAQSWWLDLEIVLSLWEYVWKETLLPSFTKIFSFLHPSTFNQIPKQPPPPPHPYPLPAQMTRWTACKGTRRPWKITVRRLLKRPELHNPRSMWKTAFAFLLERKKPWKMWTVIWKMQSVASQLQRGLAVKRRNQWKMKNQDLNRDPNLIRYLGLLGSQEWLGKMVPLYPFSICLRWTKTVY